MIGSVLIAEIFPQMKRQLIKTNRLRTLNWLGDKLVDWSMAGTVYSLEGEETQINSYHFAFGCDSAITSQNGDYAFIYKRLGTKGLLLKDGEIIREINRSYYHAETYEYPVAFVTFNNKTYLVHCPNNYCQIDFEDVETGEIVTNISTREPRDLFHSRFEVSADNKFFMSKGWWWHPWDVLVLFDIEKCLADPSLLDQGISVPNIATEICSASFIDDNKILVCTSTEEAMDDENMETIPPGHLAIWNFKTNLVSKPVKIKGEFGNVLAIDEKFCWDIYKYPKIINLETGEVVDKMEDLDTGKQQSSIISHLGDNLPLIAYNKQLHKLAFKNEENIEVLSLD